MGQGNKSPTLVITSSTLDDLHSWPINYNSLIIQNSKCDVCYTK